MLLDRARPSQSDDIRNLCVPRAPFAFAFRIKYFHCVCFCFCFLKKQLCNLATCNLCVPTTCNLCVPDIDYVPLELCVLEIVSHVDVITCRCKYLMLSYLLVSDRILSYLILS